MFKCIKEGTAEWKEDVKEMFDNVGVSIAPFTFKDVLYLIFALVYIAVAALVSVSPIVITAHILQMFQASLWVGLPIIIGSLGPAILTAMWFIIIWFKCKENRG